MTNKHPGSSETASGEGFRRLNRPQTQKQRFKAPTRVKGRSNKHAEHASLKRNRKTTNVTLTFSLSGFSSGGAVERQRDELEVAETTAVSPETPVQPPANTPAARLAAVTRPPRRSRRDLSRRSSRTRRGLKADPRRATAEEERSRGGLGVWGGGLETRPS